MEGFFLIILVMQMLSYGVVDYYKIKYGRLTVLSIFLMLFLFVFPLRYQIGEEEENLFFVYTMPLHTLKSIGTLAWH